VSEEFIDIFDVLGNETRRRILEILAEEPAYLNQLSRELRVSQQAILKHLEYLQKKGLIRPYVVEGEGGTPPKKYYELNRSIMFVGELTRDIMKHKEASAIQESRHRLTVEFDPEATQKRLRETESLEPSQRIKAVRELLTELDQTMEKVSQIYAWLAELKQDALKIGRETLRERLVPAEERRIIYKVLTMDDDELKEYFEQMMDNQREWTERVFKHMREMLGAP
jgi:ArsR family transcriptional regulator